jgi:hypothetical protein
MRVDDVVADLVLDVRYLSSYLEIVDLLFPRGCISDG